VVYAGIVARFLDDYVGWDAVHAGEPTVPHAQEASGRCVWSVETHSW
jgi:hypothetical protein